MAEAQFVSMIENGRQASARAGRARVGWVPPPERGGKGGGRSRIEPFSENTADPTDNRTEPARTPVAAERRRSIHCIAGGDAPSCPPPFRAPFRGRDPTDEGSS